MTTQPTPIQPQDRRPAKSAQRAKTRRQKELDAESVGITVDGVEYVINPNDLTGRVEMEIRKEIGMGLSELQERLEKAPGMDYLGMFMWAIRHANGEDVDLMTVLESVNAGSEFEVITEAKAPAPKA